MDESAVDCVHFNALLEACVLTAMGQDSALTQQEKHERMWEEAKLKWELTVRSIQTRRLTRLLRSIRRGGHKQPAADHLDRRNLRVLDIGRRLVPPKVSLIPIAGAAASPFIIMQSRKRAKVARQHLDQVDDTSHQANTRHSVP